MRGNPRRRGRKNAGDPLRPIESGEPAEKERKAILRGNPLLERSRIPPQPLPARTSILLGVNHRIVHVQCHGVRPSVGPASCRSFPGRPVAAILHVGRSRVLRGITACSVLVFSRTIPRRTRDCRSFLFPYRPASVPVEFCRVCPDLGTHTGPIPTNLLSCRIITTEQSSSDNV